MANKKINIRESLNKMDKETEYRYGLLNLYEGMNISIEDKKEIAEMIYNNCSVHSISKKLNEMFDKQIDEWWADMPESPIDPPEDNYWECVDDYQEEIRVNLDTIIVVDENGEYEYEDESHKWAEPNDRRYYYYGNEYKIELCDKFEIVEFVDELLKDRIPKTTGRYRVSGKAHILFDITGLLYHGDYYWDDQEAVSDIEINTDDVQVDFNSDDSYIENLKIEQIDKMNESTTTDFDYIDDDNDDEWERVASKSVPDSDGFMTDYTWYRKRNNGTEKHIFMFGDEDLYEPDENYADYETNSPITARGWFNSYEGFVDDDEIL